MLPIVLKTLQDSGDGIAVRTLTANLRESPGAKSLSPEEFKSAFQRSIDEGLDLGFISCRENHVKPMVNISSAKESVNLRAQLMLLTEELQEQPPASPYETESGEPSDGSTTTPRLRPARATSQRPQSGGLEPTTSGQRRVSVPGGSIMTAAANRRSRSGSHSRGRRHAAGVRRRSRSRGAASPARRRSRSSSGGRRRHGSRSRSQRRR